LGVEPLPHWHVPGPRPPWRRRGLRGLAALAAKASRQSPSREIGARRAAGASLRLGERGGSDGSAQEDPLVIKLYKREEKGIHYWEAWDAGRKIVMHCTPCCGPRILRGRSH